MEKYDRMMQLNYHIQDQFKQKTKEINRATLHKNKKNLLNNSK